MATIADRKPDIIFALGNRQDVDATVPAGPTRLERWCRDAYIDLCASYKFNELKKTVTTQLLSGTDIYRFPTDCRAIEYLTVYDLSNNATVLGEKDIKTVRQYTAVANGIPSIFAPWGKNIIIRPTPDQSYSFVWDYWQKAQIEDDVKSTELNLPDDWLEVFDYMVMIRAHNSLLERDKARQLQEFLFGFKTDVGKFIPGFIARKMTLTQAQSMTREMGVNPITVQRSYTR